jgi:hypothetical protein
MATLATLRVNLLANPAKFISQMKQAEARVQQFSRAATSAGTVLTKGLTVPLTAVGHVLVLYYS